MLTQYRRLVSAATLVLVTQLGFADPVSDLLSQTGLNSLINGSITGGVEADVLNPTGTGDNDLLGADVFTPENGLGVSLFGGELLGFGNTTGSTAIPLDFLGLEQLTDMLGLAPDSALVDALRNTVGPDGAVIVPIVDSVQALSGIGDASRFDLSQAITLPGFSDQPVGLAIAGEDSSGNASADGLAGVALLTPGGSGNGGLIGLAVISGSGSGNGDLIGLSVAGGDNFGGGSLAGVAVLGGDQAGNSETLALSAISGSNSGNASLIGIGAINDDNAGNGGLVGVGALNGDNSGNGGTAGVGALNGDNAGNGGFSGVSVINGDNAGNGSTAGLAVLSGDNSGNSDAIGGAVISGAGSGNGGGVSIGVGGDDDGGDGTGGGDCEGIVCGDEDDGGSLEERLLASSNCAEGDSDGDGVCDEVDDCQNTPEGAYVFSTGCHLSDNTPLILKGVNFEFDSLDVTEPSKLLLEEARNIIAKHPNALISIDGHTDAKGRESYNERLSYNRAKAIYSYFVGKGIKPERLAFRGFGEAVPVAPNTTESGEDSPEGRALNRRVELTVVDLQTFASIKADNAKRSIGRQSELQAPIRGPLATETDFGTVSEREAALLQREQQARVEALKWEQIAREEQQQAKAKAAAEAAEKEEQARREAEESERQRQKSAEAERSYDDVLEFLEATGSAEKGDEEDSESSGSTDGEADNSEYSLEVVEPDNT